MTMQASPEPIAPSRLVCLDCRHLDPGAMTCHRAAGRKANAARLNPSSCGPGARLFQPKDLGR